MSDKPYPILYILMRTDLDSMNPGKAMAQASHASNAFMHEVHNIRNSPSRIQEYRQSEKIQDDAILALVEWANGTKQGFGTVLVLSCDEQQLLSVIEIAKEIDIIADTILDPTYPVKDGKIVHYLPMITCGYLFGDKNDPIIKGLLGNLKLHS